MRRRCAADAAGARMLPPGLGGQHDHRGGAGRRRDLDPAVPARHRPALAGHRLRRRPRPHRRAEDRRLVHGAPHRRRRADHPQIAAGTHQRGLRADGEGRIDPQRRRLLTGAAMRTLLVERRDGVFEIVLNRPEILNAANREMLAELDMATAEAEADGESGAVLLRVAAVNPTMLRLRAMAKPVVAAVQGAAAGFGLSLVLAADLALAAEDAVFAAGYIHLGTSPDGAMTFTLPRTVGLKRAAELMLLGERFTARRALELGIVNRLVAADALADEARAWAARLAAGPRTAQARTKALLQAALGDDLAAQLEREAESFAACAASAEFVEGVRAFLDKRPPLFSRAASPPPPAMPR